MGYSAHVNTKRIIECSRDGYFNYSSQELNEYLNELNNIVNEDSLDYPLYTEDEYGGLLWEWEIEKEFLENCIEYLKKQNPNDYAFLSYTNEYVISAFKSWLKDSENKDNYSNPDFVYLRWD